MHDYVYLYRCVTHVCICVPTCSVYHCASVFICVHLCVSACSYSGPKKFSHQFELKMAKKNSQTGHRVHLNQFNISTSRAGPREGVACFWPTLPRKRPTPAPWATGRPARYIRVHTAHDRPPGRACDPAKCGVGNAAERCMGRGEGGPDKMKENDRFKVHVSSVQVSGKIAGKCTEITKRPCKPPRNQNSLGQGGLVQ